MTRNMNFCLTASTFFASRLDTRNLVGDTA